MWLLSRKSGTDNQTFSSRTRFNIKVRNEIAVSQDTVSYLPTTNTPATDMSTINEVLEQSLGIVECLQLSNIVCVFDQALFAKAAEIVWKHKKFKNIVIKMGFFHTICNFLCIMGKRFNYAGLSDLCVESGVLAEVSVSGVMEGRKYNRTVRVHKLVYESLLRLAWKGFLVWLEEHHVGDLQLLTETLKLIDSLRDSISHTVSLKT